MTIIRWTRPALVDYSEIISRIRNANPGAAIRIGQSIKDRLALLATMPRMGRRGRVAGTRELVLSRTPYIVIYELRGPDEQIYILRVLHGARRWPPS
ncbi:MAG TPA: type II toxin-antitoxin system RelE/ParE family toxin [Stellaceae bacterium]|nr:type II toxin-antitoxin system RelE/ParE family toxin [Stellaceae bacterium]